MVKIRGKSVALQPSRYVTKELTPKRKKKVGKGKVPFPGDPNPGEKQIQLAENRRSDDPPFKRTGRWRNKQRVLVFSSRGIASRGRHLMENMRRLLPHTRKESKMDKKDTLFSINDISEMKNCNKCLFFECRKQGDVYLWVSSIPDGPSAKFFMENVSTMEELKFTGNCLKGSRALLSFDSTFDTEPQYKLLKELFIQVFGTPYQHPKSQPFIDHTFTFTVLDNRIWFRNFQIMEEDGSLVEIGPRFTLNPIRIFEGSFHGATLWENPHFVSPGKYRTLLKKSSAGKYQDRVQQRLEYKRGRPKSSYQLDASDAVFQVDPDELNE